MGNDKFIMKRNLDINQKINNWKIISDSIIIYVKRNYEKNIKWY